MTDRLLFLIFAGLLLALPERTRAADDANDLHFATRVLPLLKQKCLACHGEDENDIRGGLDLRTREETLQGGESGFPSVIAGNAAESPVYLAALRTHDDWSAMPPKENDRLTARQLEVLKTWIERGAVWRGVERVRDLSSRAAPDAEGVRVATSGGLSPDWTNRPYPTEQLWAYRPVQPTAVPAGAEHPIDAFLGVTQREMGLKAAPPADRRTLLRRVTFDLLGLPPSPEELEAFVNDPADDDDAWNRVVDRLLASPHYGEQSARHWLDVARYADSSGFANDYERGPTWRYRDYVVRAFQQDKPYDDFIREQLAGDEINPENPEMLVATGFLRMGPWELTGMEVARIARQRFLDDVTDSVGQVFLAHPLQCARCHDHKFDPIPTRDYYSLQATFATTQLVERPAPFLAEENTAGFDERRYLEARRQRYEEDLRKLAEKEETAARAWCAERGVEYVSRAEGLKRKLPEDRLPPKHAGFAPADFGLERIARKGLERLKWELDRYEPVAWSVYSGPTPALTSVNAPQRMPGKNNRIESEVEATAILVGGDPFSPGPAVAPGVLSAAVSLARRSPEPLVNPTLFPDVDDDVPLAGRRRALSEWIGSPGNPLTARVMVNRLWQQHFGRGLAGNPNNFGATGKRPTHPELLDWLAGEFVRRGWSVKAVHRVILTSDAYRRSSRAERPDLLREKDPDGISYVVFQPRRLAAEEIRDAMLTATGELNPELGGIPNRPEMNLDAALQPRQVMGTFAPCWQPSPLPGQRHRRSLYALRLRGLPDPFLELFNQPTGESSCEARESSTIASQVFAMFNSQSTLDRAVVLADRLIRETPGGGAIDRAFQLTLQRLPNDDERRWCLAHWQEMTERHRRLNIPRKTLPQRIVREAVEENSGEPFTFTEVLDAAADFVPDLQPADVPVKVRGLAEVCLVLLNANEFVWID